MNDKAHFRGKFRTKSTIEAEYGKKLKRRGVDCKEEGIDPERKKVLKGRLESEEMLGVKAQMKAETARIKALQAAEGALRVGTAVVGTAAEVVAASSNGTQDDKNVSGDVVHEGHQQSMSLWILSMKASISESLSASTRKKRSIPMNRIQEMAPMPSPGLLRKEKTASPTTRRKKSVRLPNEAQPCLRMRSIRSLRR